MASMVEICNLALSKAGITDSIMNLDTEQSETALWCKANFAPARDAVLRDFPWNFATKNVVLSALDFDHPDGKKVYLYPSDCLNVLDVSKTLFEIYIFLSYSDTLVSIMIIPLFFNLYIIAEDRSPNHYLLHFITHKAVHSQLLRPK